MLKMTERLWKATEMAFDAHYEQTYKGEPYYSYHVKKIANAVSLAGYSEDYVIVALLHDVLEDSDKYSLKDIESAFGKDIADAVLELTKLKGTSYQKYLFNITNPLAVVVKIYDAHFNLTECLKEGNFQRAKKYSNVLSTLLEA